jgi:hypothetical protein
VAGKVATVVANAATALHVVTVLVAAIAVAAQVTLGAAAAFATFAFLAAAAITAESDEQQRNYQRQASHRRVHKHQVVAASGSFGEKSTSRRAARWARRLRHCLSEKTLEELPELAGAVELVVGEQDRFESWRPKPSENGSARQRVRELLRPSCRRFRGAPIARVISGYGLDLVKFVNPS